MPRTRHCGAQRTEADQLNAIHKRLTTWLNILFKDSKLEAAFRKCGLDSGMKNKGLKSLID